MKSQNGWSVFTAAPAATLLWITGRIRPGDVQVVFDYLCKRYNAEVEEIKVSWSWGWAFRAIRGSVSGYSNHASATAIDINAPAHPLGVRGTFSAAQIKIVNQILADLDGILRWGENYSGRKDGMHFEVDASAAAVKKVANKIRKGQMPDQKPTYVPNKAKAVHFGRVQEQFLIALGVDKGEVTQNNGVAIVQDALNRVLRNTKLEVDGMVGRDTLNAWGRWETLSGGIGRPRVPDFHSVEELAKLANIRITAKTWD